MNPFVIAFRRIIYSIPLKWLLLGLAVFSVLLASFSSASFEVNHVFITAPNQTAGNSTFNIAWSEFSWADLFCYDNRLADDVIGYSLACDGNYTYLKKYQGFCVYKSEYSSFCIRQTQGGVVSWGYFDSTEFNKPYDSLQCQTEYNLIPINSVDQQYCESNNLCPTYDCPTNPIGTGSLSNLYINNILHIGAPNIIMNIPEEIDWDYAYTMGGNTMNIDIVGYNQDQELIQGWIDTNNYKPTSSDFTNIFTNFSNFGGLLIATLFVILVFYFVKKMFK